MFRRLKERKILYGVIVGTIVHGMDMRPEHKCMVEMKPLIKKLVKGFDVFVFYEIITILKEYGKRPDLVSHPIVYKTLLNIMNISAIGLRFNLLENKFHNIDNLNYAEFELHTFKGKHKVWLVQN